MGMYYTVVAVCRDAPSGDVLHCRCCVGMCVVGDVYYTVVAVCRDVRSEGVLHCRCCL